MRKMWIRDRDWYQYLLFMAVSASFGIRGADKLLALKGKKD